MKIASLFLFVGGVILIVGGLLVNLPQGNYYWFIYDIGYGGLALFAACVNWCSRY